LPTEVIAVSLLFICLHSPSFIVEAKIGSNQLQSYGNLVEKHFGWDKGKKQEEKLRIG
jgi:hypothetical protein